MSDRARALAVLVVLPLVVVSACGGEGAPPSAAAFEEQVALARDRVDYALEQVTRADSLEAFLDRMDEAAETIADAAADLRRGSAPTGLEAELDDLVGSLEQLTFDVQATADQIRQPGFDELLAGTRGLSFESWEAVNGSLASLRDRGVEVAPLERHGGS